MSIDWTKDIEMLGISGHDVLFEVSEVSEEDGFVSIDICYSANTNHSSSADFYDTICVDYHTGKPLNYFLDPNKFTVVNVNDEGI